MSKKYYQSDFEVKSNVISSPLTEFTDKKRDIEQKLTILTNHLNDIEPNKVYDGMFFLKDNDPAENERTLYINYKGDFVPFLHINSDGTISGSGGGGGDGGTGIVNLAGSNVVGYLPLSKLSTGTDTLDNTNNFIVVDKENKIKIIDKQELLDLISGGGSVDLSQYLTITDASNTYATKTELTNGLSAKQDTGNYVTDTALTGLLATKQDKGDYITNEQLTQGLATKQDIGNYITDTELADGLATKQNVGDYATNTALTDGLALKQDKGEYATVEALNSGLAGKQDKGEYITSQQLTEGLKTKQDTGNYLNADDFFISDIQNSVNYKKTTSIIGYNKDEDLYTRNDMMSIDDMNESVLSSVDGIVASCGRYGLNKIQVNALGNYLLGISTSKITNGKNDLNLLTQPNIEIYLEVSALQYTANMPNKSLLGNEEVFQLARIVNYSSFQKCYGVNELSSTTDLISKSSQLNIIFQELWLATLTNTYSLRRAYIPEMGSWTEWKSLSA